MSGKCAFLCFLHCQQSPVDASQLVSHTTVTGWILKLDSFYSVTEMTERISPAVRSELCTDGCFEMAQPQHSCAHNYWHYFISVTSVW